MSGLRRKILAVSAVLLLVASSGCLTSQAYEKFVARPAWQETSPSDETTSSLATLTVLPLAVVGDVALLPVYVPAAIPILGFEWSLDVMEWCDQHSLR